MRLSKIKLSGFKSFVDPTVLHFPSNLVGVIGPNGCGKSNIIDAVRWVMGESSARSLRGDSMSDVIFNGSSHRKPVGQASIELVFDNSAGRVGGLWASYAEIAVRRLLGRDGQSSYFLNGSRCRRRDIADLFLGTGLGPRSYSIIEQGMISRIIEARPEELRLFLEEAAGISKYKERRRETEMRIRHTRENLERLTDLREELARQLQHLQRQAKAAEQYRAYRHEERQLRAQILTLRWRDLGAQMAQSQQALTTQETALHALIAEQRRLEAQLASGRAQRADDDALFNSTQERYYQAGTEVSRLEQYLQHQRDLQRRREEDWQQISAALEALEEQRQVDQEQREDLASTLASTESAGAQHHNEEIAAEAALSVAENALRAMQSDWETFSQRHNELRQRTEVERTRIEHLDRQLLQNERRAERLRFEQEQLSDADLEALCQECQASVQLLAAELQQAQARLSELEAALQAAQLAQQELDAQLQTAQEQSQTGRGRLASLRTLQEAALGRHEQHVNNWLEMQQLSAAPRLAEQLDVEAPWAIAAEAALSGWLDALCVSDLTSVSRAAQASLPSGRLTLFQPPAAPATAADRTCLESHVQAPWALSELLHGVQIAPDLESALARRSTLSVGETLITPEGVWCGQSWLRLQRGAAEDGVLTRSQEIQQLENALQTTATQIDAQTRQLAELREQQQSLEQQRRAAQQTVNAGHRHHANAAAELKNAEARWQQAQTRIAALIEEQAELEAQSAVEREEVQLARWRLEEALLELETVQSEQVELQTLRQQAQSDLQRCRSNRDAVRQHATQQNAALATLRVQITATDQALTRLLQQQQQLQERHARLASERSDDYAERLTHVADELSEWLETRLTVEVELSAARQRLQAQDAELADLEQQRSRCERQAEMLRQQIEEQRLAASEARIKQQTLREQLLELAISPEDLLATLEAGTQESECLAQLEQVERRIQRLGAINLAAIDEYAQAAERQGYLDAQNADLLEALGTLEEAMRKMDRETRARFRQTFEQVNDGLQQLFPRLFGGGEAHLLLTGDDALDAGIAIMAKPPGKRISTISLLSGGEKALTAVALVFAIFQLNPAPFCLLDEVDAPLDEANVRRFGTLVQEMSEQVQFIFITHNKATMEIAEQLAGVTMQEPGVSRLVAVDIAEAVRLAGV